MSYVFDKKIVLHYQNLCQIQRIHSPGEVPELTLLQPKPIVQEPDSADLFKIPDTRLIFFVHLPHTTRGVPYRRQTEG